MSRWSAGVRMKILRFYNQWFVQEAKRLFKLCLPISLSIFFQVSLLWFSLLFLGHLPNQKDSGSYQYTAAGLGSAFLNVTGFAVGQGIATAADTLSSQAFGFKNYKRVGVILQRGVLIMGLVLFPIWALLLNTESLLLLVQQPPCVARFSDYFVKLFTLALPFTFLYILLQHYLQSQSIVWQFVLIGLISNVANVILNAIVVYGFGFGFIGAVTVLVISSILPPILVICYIWCRKLYKETWGGWSFQALEEWGLFLKLAVPGFLMIALEWWGLEILNFLAGALSETELAANIVWYQLLYIMYFPSLGLSIAASVRVGNELGARNPLGAKRAFYVALAAILFFSTITNTFLLSTKDVISLAFVPGNREVADKVSRLISYICVPFITSDQLQIMMAGVLRGSGRQYIGAIANFIGYYVVGIPLAFVLGFKTTLGIVGIWIGMTVGNLLISGIVVIALIRTDWQKESREAIERAQGLSSQVPDEEIVAINDSNLEERAYEETTSTTSFSISDEDTGDPFLDVENKEVDEHHVEQSSGHFSKKLLSYKMRKLLIHGSFYILGICILIGGGVSSVFHPHIDPEEYSNCTSFENSSIKRARSASVHTDHD